MFGSLRLTYSRFVMRPFEKASFVTSLIEVRVLCSRDIPAEIPTESMCTRRARVPPVFTLFAPARVTPAASFYPIPQTREIAEENQREGN